MAERRPRSDEFAERRDYYTAMLGWLQRRYPDDQLARVKKWRRIEKEEQNAKAS